jgi:hypothetical protein
MSGTPGNPSHLRRAWSGTVIAAVVLCASAACTSDKAHDKSPSTAPSTTTQSRAALPTAFPSLPANPPTTPDALAALIRSGLAATGYARVHFSSALAGNALSGAGRVVLAGGKVAGLDVRDQISGIGSVHFLLVNNVPYAALPKPTKPGKPYVVIGGSTSGDQLSRAAIGLQATGLLAAPDTYRTLVAAGTKLTLVGTARVGPTPALHYRTPVDLTRIPSSDPVRVALGALTVSRLDLDLWVDGAGRPLKASAPAPDGRPTDVTFSDINQPFTIAAPPAAQVDGAH